MVDARAGATSVDLEVADYLRRKAVPVVLVANKVDTPAREDLIWDLHELGLGDPLPVSAKCWTASGMPPVK